MPVRVGLLACLLFLLGCSQAVAAPAWLSPVDLSAPGKDATNSTVAMDDAGDTVAIWERQNVLNHDVQVSTRSPGNGFTGPVGLSTESTDPDVAMAPDGEAVAVWRHFDIGSGNYVIQASVRPKGGSFSAPIDVSTSPNAAIPQDLEVVVNAAGAAALVWTQKDPGSLDDPNQFSVLVSVRPAGGSFSAPVIVSPQPLTVGDNADGPRLAIDPTGDVAVVWSYFDSAVPREEVQAATRSAGGSFSAPMTLSDTGKDAFFPAIAMDSAGDAIAVWTGSDGTNYVIQQSTSQSGGAFAAPVGVSAAGEDASTPQIAMTPGGAATLVWVRADTGGYSIVQTSTGSPAAGFSAPLDLSVTGSNSFDPKLALNASGAATAVWKGSDGLNSRVQAAVRPPGGSFGPAQNLSAAGQDAVFPEVAVDGEGDATAVWWRSNGSNEIVQTAGFDADAPELRDVSIPATGMVGDPVSFSVNPFDVWPITSTGFSFGDGAVASGSSATHVYSAKGTYPVTVTATDSAGTPVSTSGSIAILPSNRFEIGRLSLNRKKGTGTLAVIVPGPGKLVLSGRAVKKATKQARRAGTIKLPIVTRGKTLKHLRKRGKAKVQLTISFTPDGGTKLSKHKTATLILKLKG